ncbi:MAG: GHKL domain-containing protein [Clostridia bacterium]|nr:GHKL domain-containing protein [Clostridia bacterium]
MATALKTAGCCIGVKLAFSVSMKKKVPAAIFLIGYTVVYSVVSVKYGVDDVGILGWITELAFTVVIPLAFLSRRFIKIAVFSFIWDLISGTMKYLFLMFGKYDWLNPEPMSETVMQTAVNAVLLVSVLSVYLYFKKTGRSVPPVKGNASIYLLISVSLMYFVLTMIVLGENNSAERRGEFLMCLGNIPLFAFTIGYCIRRITKSKMAEENYRNRLDMQMRHYEDMEHKNEELRIFRHDLPKKLAPLLMFAEQGNTEEIRGIVNSFNVTLNASRPRYVTGNGRLDTVLDCEQQAAQKHGLNIVWTTGSTFPENGIEPDDIYTIFPNALDNAIEAASKLDEPSEITVTSKQAGQMVYVIISNRFTGELNRHADSLKTLKNDKTLHGYGMKSIKKAAAAYGENNVRFEINDGIFSLIIELMPHNIQS